VASLHEEKFVIREGNEYRLGLRFLDLGTSVRNRREEYRMMKSTTRALAEKTGELVSFMVKENGRGVFLYRERGEQGVESAAHVGKRADLHTTASGKALLANLPQDEIREIIDEYGLSAQTEATITDKDELLEELDEIVESNLAFSVGEYTQGLASVGAPVVRPDGEVLGGLSVAGPRHRMTEERFHETIPQQLLSIVNEFELNVTYG
jgi:DNA-binding IclR family transcriptional regulator